jgi:hypothetical protein
MEQCERHYCGNAEKEEEKEDKQMATRDALVAILNML